MNRRFAVIPNAIDVEKYLFDEGVRRCLRRDFGLGDSFVVGCVGKIEDRKNQAFLIELMPELKKALPDIKLLIVGDGTKRKMCERMSRALSVDDKVVFTGERNDVCQILNIFDVLVMPSLFEGFPVALVEAQANGLPCIVSDTVTSEADLTGEVDWLSLKGDGWVQAILKKRCSHRLAGAGQIVGDAGFDIRRAACRLERKYWRMLNL